MVFQNSSYPIHDTIKQLIMNGTEIPVKVKERKYDRSHAEIVLQVRQFFEFESQQGKSLHLNRLLEKTFSETGVSARTLYKPNQNAVWRIGSTKQENLYKWSKIPQSVNAFQCSSGKTLRIFFSRKIISRHQTLYIRKSWKFLSNMQSTYLCLRRQTFLLLLEKFGWGRIHVFIGL